MDLQTNCGRLSRRRLLSGAAGTFLLAGCGVASASSSIGIEPVRSIEPLRSGNALDWRDALLAGERSILMRRDGPATRVRYGNRDGTLDRDGYVAACHMLRDVRAHQTVQIDPELLDVLCGIQRWMEFNGKLPTIEITSGFRTFKTNDREEGAARHSMHLYGKAADIIVPGASSAMIGAMVQRFNDDGGTGIYPGRQFVHIDTGAPRTWTAGPRTSRRRRHKK